MVHEPDTLVYTTAIDLKKTDHSVAPDSKHILINTEYRDFTSLEDAAAYLFSHVVGLKNKLITKAPLDKQIGAATARTSEPNPTTSYTKKREDEFTR